MQHAFKSSSLLDMFSILKNGCGCVEFSKFDVNTKIRYMKSFAFLFIFACCLFINCSCLSRSEAGSRGDTEESVAVQELNYQRLKKYAGEAKKYCSRNKMNTDICLLADMNIHSGKERFVVWNFNKDTVQTSGLVSHGCSDNPWGKDLSKGKPVFSNRQDSHCSSLGKYKVGERGYSQWGIHVKYLMHGLEATNKNALSREIVLHSWDAISDHEVYPDGTPEGWGCPAVSNKFMTELDRVLKNKKKPVLLWAFE
jgi:hypothetical protein